MLLTPDVERASNIITPVVNTAASSRNLKIKSNGFLQGTVDVMCWMVDIHNSKLSVSHFATRFYWYNSLYRLSVHVTHYDSGCNVKVSVFNTYLKYEVKESHNNAAPIENSSIQRFPSTRSPFLQKGNPSGKTQGKKFPINIRNWSANGTFSMATTDIGAKARSFNQWYRNRMGLRRKKWKDKTAEKM